MRMNEVTYTEAVPFRGYGAGGFTLGEVRHEGDLLVSDTGVAPWGGYEDTAAILELSEQVDFVLIGTGVDIGHIPQAFRRALEEAGIGVEIMSTASACRTYNVLLSEGRRMAAAVLAV